MNPVHLFIFGLLKFVLQTVELLQQLLPLLLVLLGQVRDVVLLLLLVIGDLLILLLQALSQVTQLYTMKDIQNNLYIFYQR